LDTDYVHFSTIKGSPAVEPNTENLDWNTKHGSVVDTDAAHFASIKGPSSPDSSPQKSDMPTWRKYVINNDIHIIEEKKVSFGTSNLCRAYWFVFALGFKWNALSH
jgi:hypothetical protein